MIFRSIFATLYLLIVTPLASFFCFITSLLGDRKGIFWWRAARLWAMSVLKSGGVTKIIIYGKEKLEKTHKAIFMSNHKSQFDPLALASLSAKSPIRFFAKHTLSYFPFFGQALWATGMIFINRKKPMKSFQAIEKAIARIKNRDKFFFVFPEGKRSKIGELLQFKIGGFVMAKKAKLPILPIGIAGTGEILPPGFLIREKGPVVIAVGDLIPSSVYENISLDELVSRVRAQVSELQEKAARIRRELVHPARACVTG
jgi:1-acyl-sn-glycerol-3-phosphate acyltransferase